MRVMEILAKFLVADWNVLFVCLSSVPMIALQLAIPRVLALVVGTAVEQEHLRASAVLSIDLAPYCALISELP